MSADNGRTRASLGAVVVVLLLALLFWWTGQSGDDGSGRDAGEASSQSGAQPETPGTAVDDPSPGSDDAPSPSPTQEAPADDVPGTDPGSGLPVVEVTDLPGEAAEVLADIDRGGPYDYDRDGVTFGNYEGVLPDEQRGYYREYTVETPGLSHRGARRIVVGGGTLFYWTDDHYESFSRIWR